MISENDFGRRRLLGGTSLTGSFPVVYGLSPSEGQFYCCPVSHFIPVKNQLDPVSAPRDFLLRPHCACAVANLFRQPQYPKEPLFLEGHGFTHAEKQATDEGF
jgi:hypothetical protein